MIRIDAHQHFWRLKRGDYGWLTAADHPGIYRDFAPQDLAPLMRDAEIDATVLVQAAPSPAETAFLLDIAAATPFVAGVVGWADLAAPEAPATIEALARDANLRGLRPMLQDLPDEEWILRPELAPAWVAMISARLRLDALVKPRHLPHLARFLAAHPDLSVVIDHGAKPDIADGALQSWGDAMRVIARDTAAFCKLSGLVTEAAPGWREEDLRPYVDVLLEAFGPARLMWGSDWPVVNEAGGYATWHAAARSLVEAWPLADRDQIFGGAAQRFYGLGA